MLAALKILLVVALYAQQCAAKGKSGSHGDPHVTTEMNSVPAIDIAFHQQPDEWRVPGHGISLDATGEPKSGTSWLGRLVPELALELCGNPDNTWCEMGGLVVTPPVEKPHYEFEMLKKGDGDDDSLTLFLHFKANLKHIIPGMEAMPSGHRSCQNGGRPHPNGFMRRHPCTSGQRPTRARLLACMWDTSPSCLQYMPSMDPAVRRTIVIMRDPREVVMSERHMRIDYYKQRWVRDLSVDEFARDRFEVLVSWEHQRWTWHTTTPMNASSHVVIYDELEEDPAGLIDMAAFMGLECSPASALKVWEAHEKATAHRDYTMYGLQQETIQWMNATMARLLPVPLALKWGITPTEV